MDCKLNNEPIPACVSPVDSRAEILNRNWENKNYQYVEVLRRIYAKEGAIYDYFKHPYAEKGEFVLRND